jgi:hypothetical protein
MFRHKRESIETVPATAIPREPFVCSSCGRSDLPETGDWDPPICLECDAAINMDADMELMALEAEQDDDEHEGFGGLF